MVGLFCIESYQFLQSIAAYDAEFWMEIGSHAAVLHTSIDILQVVASAQEESYSVLYDFRVFAQRCRSWSAFLD